MADAALAWLAIAPVLLGVGVVAGLLAGLLGVGGGIVIVPALFLLSGAVGAPAEHAMHMAVATSLACIVPTSIASMRAHMRRGGFDAALFRAWAPWMCVGAGLGGLGAASLNAAALGLIFGVVALGVAANMALGGRHVLAAAPPQGVAGSAALAGPIGGVSAAMGVGGGTLSVPVLKALSFPMHRAVGTAAAFGLVIAAPGVVGFLLAEPAAPTPPQGWVGYVNLPAALIISAATYALAPIGARLAHVLSADRLRLAFALFLAVSASRMIWNAVGG